MTVALSFFSFPCPTSWSSLNETKMEALTQPPLRTNWHLIVRHPRRIILGNCSKNVNDKLEELCLPNCGHETTCNQTLLYWQGRQAGTGNKSREIVYYPTNWLTDWLGGRKPHLYVAIKISCARMGTAPKSGKPWNINDNMSVEQ